MERFSVADKLFISEWIKDQRNTVCGDGVNLLILRCSTASADIERFNRPTGETGHDVWIDQSVWVNYDWITVDTRVTVTPYEITKRVKTRATGVNLSLSSMEGTVDVKVYAAFYKKVGKEREIADVVERILRVGRTSRKIVLHSQPIEDYVGYGVAAFNLANGELLALEGSAHHLKKQLEKDIEFPE